MNAYIRNEYLRLRRKGWTASAALRAARIEDMWTDLANEGVVCIEHPFDDEPYDDSYIDTWDDLSPTKRERAKKEVHDLVERHGLYGIRGEFFDGKEWVEVDAVWSLIGNDLTDNGYDVDIKFATIVAYRDHQDHVATMRAEELASRATLAGPADHVLAHYLGTELLS